MSEVNVDESLIVLGKIWSERRYDGPVQFDDLRAILNALRSPVEQKTCEHSWNFRPTTNIGVCNNCGIQRNFEPKQENLSLAEKFREYLNRNNATSPVSYKEMEEMAEFHYASLFAVAKEEGRKEGEELLKEKLFKATLT